MSARKRASSLPIVSPEIALVRISSSLEDGEFRKLGPAPKILNVLLIFSWLKKASTRN
ncbi:MAG: hypothetical protein HYW01_03555 [Deltaproteobacteria bacterium]|nr:hypothetical protein [Deltaproteobacteria bacterium]